MATESWVRYRIVKLDGGTLIINLPKEVPVGWRGKISYANVKNMHVYLPGTARVFVEIEADSPMIKKKVMVDTVVAIVGVTIMLAGIILSILNIGDNIGLAPDADVIRAAQSVNINAVVSKSHYSWTDGCDTRDTRRYDVSVDGKKIAIVCQGNVNPVFDGWKQKAPTVRYATED
jgi:hypothetical protein